MTHPTNSLIIPSDVIEKNLGLSATVEIEGSCAHKLQIKSLISTQQNSSLPAYAPFNSQNSEKLPAQFVLKLSQPLPVLNTSINQIANEINEPATIKDYLTSLTANSKESLINLIARQELDSNKRLRCRTLDSSIKSDGESCDTQKHVYSVKLLNQYHTYHILDHYLERQDGVYLDKIPFTHPTSIPSILRVLRQQALFNFVIGSCIRRNRNNTNSKSQIDENSSEIQPEMLNIFDIIPINLNNICISFEHPSKESLATLEIDIREFNCQLHAIDQESLCTNEFATKVLQKCWSIPVTLRSVLKKCDERRLTLLEDANKRRERELQELLANNTTQQGLQYKSHQYQETLLQSKFSSLNEKSNPHDLNSMAEFFTSKLPNYNVDTCETSNQITNASVNDGASNRSNLLSKFSCKPKAKHSTINTKNQSANKILSLMLKRPNSTSSSAEDANLKATLTKKAKTKLGESSGTKYTSGGASGLTTTKLISTEAATAARLASNKAKQATTQNASISLIRSPNKAQPGTISSSNQIMNNVNLTAQTATSSAKQFDVPTGTLISRAKLSQPNGSNSSNKPRKSSINSVIDRLVGEVNSDQNHLSSLLNSGTGSDYSNEASKSVDSSEGSPLGAKSSKNRATSDQFAIKQGSSGGLKLTVTKTKPTGASASSSGNTTSSTLATTSSTGQTSSTSSPATLTSSTPLAPNNTNPQTSNRTEAANKILGLGSSAPTIKYTIPKISKTQQTPQSNPNQSNSSDQSNQNSATTSSESSNQGDESTNLTSSATSSANQCSTTTVANNPSNKRSTPTPFNRNNNNNSNRNPVSSSTHPLGRTTSNPLANPNRPSSTSNETHLLNRISSSNQTQQNMRQQMNYRMSNEQQLQSSTSQPQPQLQQPAVQRMINPNIAMAQFVSDSLQRPSPSVINEPPQFYIRQPMFIEENATPSTQRIQNNDAVVQSSVILNNNNCRKLDANTTQPIQQPLMSQAPLMNALNFQLTRPIFMQQSNLAPNMANEMSPGTVNLVNAIQKASASNQGVSSTSDKNPDQPIEAIMSTPSSPTECGQIETVKPPPLIPIDSLDEPEAALLEVDQADDASDRLSIVDMNENIADSNSVSSTPKPSNELPSPLSPAPENSAIPSSSSRNIDSTSTYSE